MADGPTSESDITPDNPAQHSVHIDVQDGTPSNADIDAAIEKILAAAQHDRNDKVSLTTEDAEDKRDGNVRLVIEEHGLTELRGAAVRGRLSAIAGKQGLTKLLHHAAEYGNEGLLQIVFDDPQIDVNAVLGDSEVEVLDPCKGCTALILACCRGHTKIVEELLRKDADVHIYTKDGLTCLHLAAFSGHSEVVNLLLHGKFQRISGDEYDLQYLDTFRREGEKVNLDRHGYTALQVSCSKRRWALIERKSKIEEFTALHMAVGGSYDDHDNAVGLAESILAALVDSVLVVYGVPTNLGRPSDFETDLWVNFLVQIQEGLHPVDGEISLEGILQDLAAYGNRVSGFGRELRMKLGTDYEGLVRAFVELVSYSNAKDMVGRTVLHHATWQNRYNLVQFLMWNAQFGCLANVNTADVDGLTALHLASWRGYERVAKELLSCSHSNRTEDGLDHLLEGKTYIQANVGTTRPSYSSAHILLTKKKVAKKLEMNLRPDRSGRSLVFMKEVETSRVCVMELEKVGAEKVEVEEVFYYYYYFKIIINCDAEVENADSENADTDLDSENADSENADTDLEVENAEKWLGVTPIWFESRTGVTPLHYAVECNHVDVVGLLMVHPNTDAFRRASDGQSPWTIAFPLQMHKSPSLHNPTPTQRVLSRGLRTETSCSRWLRTATSLSRGRPQPGSMMYMSDLGTLSMENYVQSRNAHQRQLLKQAIELSRSSETDSVSEYNLQVLEGQIKQGLLDQFESLEYRNVIEFPDSKDYLGSFSLLHAAAWYGLGPEIEVLLALKTYRHQMNDTFHGLTALHFAIDGGIDAVAALLKERTLNLSQETTTRSAHTPLDFVQVRIDFLKSRPEPRFMLDDEPMLRRNGITTYKKIQRMLMENPILVERLYRDRQVFTDAANAILVGAALIASVTFGGFLQPPLGYVPFNAAQSSTPQNFAAVEQHISVRVFWAFNSLSFFWAIATVVAGAGTVLPTSGKSIEEEVRMVRKWLRGTAALLAISIFCVLGAFTASGFASLPNAFRYEKNMIATSATGLAICVTVLCLFSHRLYLSLNPSSTARIIIRETSKGIKFIIKVSFKGIKFIIKVIKFIIKVPFKVLFRIVRTMAILILGVGLCIFSLRPFRGNAGGDKSVAELLWDCFAELLWDCFDTVDDTLSVFEW